MGVTEKDGGYAEGGVLAYGEVCGDEIGPVDIELGKKVEIHEVVDASGVPALQELLVELAVLAEVLPEILENAATILFDEDLVPADSRCAVVDGNGYHLTSSYHFNPRQRLCVGKQYKSLGNIYGS